MLRTALALSALTAQPFRMKNIRANRSTPGLKAQHLHCIKATMQLCEGKSEGAAIGSQEITFYPGKLTGKKIEIDIGTAGSVTLLTQSILLPAMFAKKQSTFILSGGTNVSWSMPIEYVQEILAPQLRRYCEKLEINLLKRGYHPKGMGKVEIKVVPKWKKSDAESIDEFILRIRTEIQELQILDQTHLHFIKGISHASIDLQKSNVTERQSQGAKHLLRTLKCPIDIREEYANTASTGSGITLWATFSKNKDDIDASKPIILGADELGERNKTAETVGESVAKKLISEIKSGAAVDTNLADNLIPLMGIIGNASIKTSTVSEHTRTNIKIVEQFLKTRFTIDEQIIRTCNQT